jgi:hypothetical protein
MSNGRAHRRRLAGRVLEFTPRREDIELSHKTRSLLGGVQRAVDDPEAGMEEMAVLLVDCHHHLDGLSHAESLEASMQLLDHVLSAEAGTSLKVFGWGWL